MTFLGFVHLKTQAESYTEKVLCLIFSLIFSALMKKEKIVMMVHSNIR